MRLIVALVDSSVGRRALDDALARGLPAVLIWTDAGALTGGRATLLVGVRDQDAWEVCTSLAAMGAATEPAAHSLLPLSDPTDLHVGRSSASGASESGLYILRVSRFELIW